MTKSDSQISEVTALKARFTKFARKISVKKKLNLLMFKEFRCPEKKKKAA